MLMSNLETRFYCETCKVYYIGDKFDHEEKHRIMREVYKLNW